MVAGGTGDTSGAGLRKLRHRNPCGTTTERDTINTVLREVTARYRRLRALGGARERVADGAVDIDFMSRRTMPASKSSGGERAPDAIRLGTCFYEK